MAEQCPRCAKPFGDEPVTCPACAKDAKSDESLEQTRFCSQECLRASFIQHNREVHQPRRYVPPEFDYTGELRPHYTPPQRKCPTYCDVPDYAQDPEGVAYGELRLKRQRPRHIPQLKTAEDFEAMREACKLARHVLDMAGQAVRPGVTTQHIDDVVHAECEKLKVYPSPLNYFCFPKSVCTSVNEVICHGIPDTRPLVKGDIVNIDVTIYHRGFHADLNETFLVFDESVEEVDEDSRRLVKVTHDALMAAIRAAKPGMMFRQFGKIISQYVKKHSGNRYGVVRSYCGHGIGRLFHCAPNVPHYAKNKAVGVLKPGMCFTIEPMVNATKEWRDVTWTDNWTAVTVDGARSAQFEHTLLVTKTGVEILTARTEESVPFWWEQPQQAVEQDAVAN